MNLRKLVSVFTIWVLLRIMLPQYPETFAYAQMPANGYITASGSQVFDNSGGVLNGKLVFTVTDSSDTPITYTPAGGSPTTATYTANVVNGVIQNNGGYPFFIANLDTMTPSYASGSRYRIVATNNAGSTTYYTLKLTPISGVSNFSMDSYRAPAGVVITGAGLPKIPCTPGAQYSNTQASDPYNWVCSKVLTDSSIYWTQNPAVNPTACQDPTMAFVSPLKSAPFCLTSQSVYGTQQMVMATPPGGVGPIKLIPSSSIAATANAPGSPYQMQIRDPAGAVLGASNITVSSDRNSVTAPDQMSANRVNGLWNFDQMGTNTQNNLVQAGCQTAACSSNSGLGTTSTDVRITPNAPISSYINDAAGVNGTFNPIAHYRQTGYFGWKAQNTSATLNGQVVPFAFNHTSTHQTSPNPFPNNLFPLGITENYYSGNEDFSTLSRQNHNGLNIAMNSAGGQVGALIGADSYNFGKGDNVGLSQDLQCAGHNEGDDEGCEFYRRFTYDQSNRWGVNLTSVPTLQASGLYNLTGTLGLNYNTDKVGLRNGVMDLTQKYNKGNIQSMTKCNVLGLGNSVCLTPDAAATWAADFGTSTMQVCHVVGTIIPAPDDTETGGNRNSVTCNVSSTSGFTSGTTVVLSGHNFDLCNITSIVTNTSITLACKEGHRNDEVLSTGGMAGYAFNFDADLIPNGQVTNKIGQWPVNWNNGTDIRRQVAPIMGFDGTNMILYTGFWSELTTMGLPMTVVSSPPVLSVTTSSGAVTGVSITSQTSGAYQPPIGALNGGSLVNMLPVPTITFSGGCTAVATFAGYIIDTDGQHYKLNNPTVTTAGSGCSGTTTATAQTLYSNPYGIYPYAQTYSILTNNGTTYGPTGTQVYVTLMDPSKWHIGDLVENEIFIHTRIHKGYESIAKYNTMNSSNFGSSGDHSFLGLMASDSAERYVNANNGAMFPSRNNPPGNNKGYIVPPTTFEIFGPWRTFFRVSQPYATGFSNAPSGTWLNSRGTVFEITCTTFASPGVDCGSSRDDYDLFKMAGSPVGNNGVDEIYYSPDLRSYFFTNQVRIQGGNNGGAPNLVVDGAITAGTGLTINGPVTIPNPLNIPVLAPGNAVVNTSTTFPVQANQFHTGITCAAAGLANLTLPTVTSANIGAEISFQATNGSQCNVVSSQGIGNVTTATSVNIPSNGWLIVRWDGNAWRIVGQSALGALSGSIGGSALTAGTCTTGTVSVSGAAVGRPVSVAASDGTLPDPLIVLRGAVTSAGTVTVQLCAIANVTPTAKTYNVSVIN